jgi:hypothetical protein
MEVGSSKCHFKSRGDVHRSIDMWDTCMFYSKSGLLSLSCVCHSGYTLSSLYYLRRTKLCNCLNGAISRLNKRMQDYLIIHSGESSSKLIFSACEPKANRESASRLMNAWIVGS